MEKRVIVDRKTSNMTENLRRGRKKEKTKKNMPIKRRRSVIGVRIRRS